MDKLAPASGMTVSPPGSPLFPSADQFVRACEKGDLKTVKVLVARGANVMAKNLNGDTALHFSCKKGNVEVSQFLLQKGANIQMKNNHGLTPLHVACYNGHLRLVQLLVKLKADIHAVNRNEWTPLHVACYKGHRRIIEFLLENGASLQATSNGWTPLHVACYEGHPEVAEFLVMKGADLSAREKRGGMPLHWACQEGHIEVAELLVKSGADIHAKNSNELTPLHVACDFKHLNVVQMLITNGADVHSVDKDLWTPLHIACIMGHFDVAKFLISKGANIRARDKDGQTPLHVACFKGQREVAAYLLEVGAEVHAVDENGDTPLHWVCSWGHSDICRSLIRKGSDIHAKDNDGDTPLHYAAHKGHLELVNILLEAEVSLDLQNNAGDTALHYACRYDHLVIVKRLVSAGAKVDLLAQDGAAPLHIVCGKGQMDAIMALVDAGGSLVQKDSNGRTPLDYAPEDVVVALQAKDSIPSSLPNSGSTSGDESRNDVPSEMPTSISAWERAIFGRERTEVLENAPVVQRVEQSRKARVSAIGRDSSSDILAHVEQEWGRGTPPPLENLLSTFPEQQVSATASGTSDEELRFIRGEKRREEVVLERQNVEAKGKRQAEVSQWLHSIGLEEYVELFVNAGCDSLSLVRRAVDLPFLQSIGISLPCHQRALLRGVDDLMSSIHASDWLESIGMGQYANNFEENGCTSMVIVRTALDDEALKSLGVLPLLHRRTILGKIRELNTDVFALGPRRLDHPEAEELAQMIVSRIDGAAKVCEEASLARATEGFPTTGLPAVDLIALRLLRRPDARDSASVFIDFTSSLFKVLSSRSDIVFYTAPSNELTNPRATPDIVGVRRGHAMIWGEVVFFALVRREFTADEPMAEMLRLFRLLFRQQPRRTKCVGVICDANSMVIVRMENSVVVSSGIVPLWALGPTLTPGEGCALLQRFLLKSDIAGFVPPKSPLFCPIRLSPSLSISRLDVLREGGQNTAWYALLDGRTQGTQLGVLKSGDEEFLRHEGVVLREFHHDSIPVVLWNGLVQSQFVSLVLPVGVDTFQSAESLGAVDEHPEFMERLVDLAREIESALVVAHGKGWIHGRVRPENCLLTPLQTARGNATLKAVLIHWTDARRDGSLYVAERDPTFTSFRRMEAMLHGVPHHVEERDDWESLFFTLLFVLAGGSLPWIEPGIALDHVLSLKREYCCTKLGWDRLRRTFRRSKMTDQIGIIQQTLFSNSEKPRGLFRRA